MEKIKRIIISRTDNLGDVVLTLPLCGALKKEFKDTEIFFLGKNYAKPVIDCSVFVDKFISIDTVNSLNKHDRVKYLKEINADVIIHVFPNKTIAKLAKRAKIKYRIGTIRRFTHLLNCNKLVYLKRKNSNLHESQLNLRLLKPLKIKYNYVLTFQKREFYLRFFSLRN